MSKTGQKKAIVIGAGAGGIATAARLAKSGFAVTVLEKNSFTGGRCSLIHHDGYRFDQGPSLLLLPKLFREAFYDLDTTLENFELSTDLARMKDQIERWEGKDGFERYLAWLREAHQHYELSVSDVLHKNFTSWWDLANPSFVWTGLKLHPLHTIWNRASLYFWTERLRRVFTFATMYMGMSPFDAPATYSLLQYTELAEGIWYPRGGFHTVLAALARVAERLGVEFRLNTAVAEVLTTADGRTANGVRLASGERLEADVVVVNADLVYAYSNLFPQTEATKEFAASLRERAGSCSSVSFYWSLDRQVPELQTHNIFLADDFRESFDDIFTKQSLPVEPTASTPRPRPAGRDAVIALVPTGHLLKSKGHPKSAPTENGMLRDQDWPALVARARSAVLATVEARTGCAPLAGMIQHEIVNDPFTWEDKFNLDKGSILGLSHSFFNVLKFRPSTRAVGLANAYFVGASTHPGTGVPIVLAGAKITAEQILADRGLRPGWKTHPDQLVDLGVPQNRGTKMLDRVRRPLFWPAVLVAFFVAWFGLAAYYWTPLVGFRR
ncbi:phytoene desaturase [Apiospora phragmitis]|uniref:Phytoene desaturase n=1 Tax=Apiospora phragmitis TaxID=2905665 RepID=A0ABR1V0Q5_9PEZI